MAGPASRLPPNGTASQPIDDRWEPTGLHGGRRCSAVSNGSGTAIHHVGQEQPASGWAFPTSCPPSGAGAQTAGAGHVYSLANANQKKILFLQQHRLSRGENVPRSLIGRPSRQIWREGLANHSYSLCHLGGSRPPTLPRFCPPDYQMDERKPRHVSGRFGRLRPGIIPSEIKLTHYHPTRGARINKLAVP